MCVRARHTTLFATAVSGDSKKGRVEGEMESSWVEEVEKPGTVRNLYLLNI